MEQTLDIAPDFYTWRGEGSFSSLCADAPIGSFILNQNTGVLYIKQLKPDISTTRVLNTPAELWTEEDAVYYPFTGLVDGDVINGNYTLSDDNVVDGVELSDDRKKNYGDELPFTLAQICKIPTKYFSYKGEDTIHIGTSAQAIQALMPELVKKNAEGYLMVDYAKLSVVAISGLKKLHQENLKIKRRLRSLEEDMEQIKKKLDGNL